MCFAAVFYNIIGIVGLRFVSVSISYFVFSVSNSQPKLIYNTYEFFSIFLYVDNPNGSAFAYLLVSLWSSFILAEQLCITLLLFVKSRINIAIIVSFIFCVCLALASGTVRSFQGLQPFLKEGTKAIHTRYASTLLHSAVFLIRPMNCTPGIIVSRLENVVCPSAHEYILERFGRVDPQVNSDMAASIGFAIGFIAFNMLLYLIPVPSFIRRKFKD